MECRVLKDTLDLYERASGQAINYGKSGIFFSHNVGSPTRNELKTIFGVSANLNTGRYLGLSSLIGRGKLEIFRYVRERLWSKLQHWRTKKLSKAGKEVLLKAAAQSIPAYCMSTFLLPPSLLDDLHKMMNFFWWGHGDDPKKGVKWATWEKLCWDKKDGGMGFRNLHLFNIAMLGKLGWTMLKQPGSLIGLILKAKYYPSSDVLNANLGHNPSYTWRGIHYAQHLVLRGVRWKIGEGDKVSFWYDKWIDDDNSFNIQLEPVPSFEDMVVKEFFVPGTRKWDVEVIHGVFSEVDRDRILRTIPGPEGTEDTIIWHFGRKGIYTVKSAYKLARDLVYEVDTNTGMAWERIWKFKIPPRIKSFFWRLCKGFMAVKEKLGRWYSGLGTLCPVCARLGMTESVWHLFVDCEFAKSCWEISGLWRKVDGLCYEVDEFPELLTRILADFSSEETERITSISWALWRNRNQLVWNGMGGTPQQVVHNAAWTINEWKEVRLPLLEPHPNIRCNQWHRPEQGMVKIIVDASFFSSSLKTGVGFALRDETGAIICLRTMSRDGLMRVDDGEAWEVLEALCWASELRVDRVIIETDSQHVQMAYASAEPDESSFGDLISQLGRE